MEKPINVRHLSQQDILTSQTEIIRCLIILLLRKRTVSYEEIHVAFEFAKQRLNSPVHDKRFAHGASEYVDLLWATLQPDEHPTKPTMAH